MAGDTSRSNLSTGIIDTHHHFTTPHYNESTKAQFAREISGIPGAASGLKFTLENSLEAMDSAGVATSILSLANPGTLLDNIDETIALTRHCNEFAADAVRDNPGRFGHFASLPLPNIDASLREIEYALDTLNADGFIVHTNDADIWLGDKQYWPIYEELNRRSAVLFVHPCIPCSCHPLPVETPPSILEYPFDTARAIVNLIYSGAAKRFPNISYLFCHGGGAMPMLVDRIETVGRARPDLGEHAPEGATTMLRSFYYDTATILNPVAFNALRSLVDPTHILFGTDMPFANLPMCLEKLEALVTDAADRKAIQTTNALSLMPQLNRT